MFTLVGEPPLQRLGGGVPWWTVDELRISFFRPLTVLTHRIDYILWPDSPALMHLHSLFYFAALLLLVHRLYERLAPRLALWAGIVYAASYIHADPVGWLANRNAVIGTAFGVAALLAYIAWRERGGSRRLAASLVLLGAALLSAEIAVSLLGFFVAYELVLASGPLRRRAAALAGPLLVVLGWRFAYRALGHGSVGSGAYLDPFQDPLLFASELPARWLQLLLASAVPMRSLSLDVLPVAGRWLLGALLGLAALAIFVQAFRARRDLAFWLVGAGLAMLPLAASVPGERLLGGPFIGFAPVIAATLLRGWRGPWLERSAAGLVVASQLVISPAILALGSYERTYDMRELFREPAGLHLGDDATVREKSVVIVSAESYSQIVDLQAARRSHSLVRPRFVWVLAIGELEDIHVRRDGCCSLVLESAEGLHAEKFASFFRGPQHPLEAGARVETLELRITVESVTASGFARRVRFDFERPLDAPHWAFVQWDGRDLAAYPLPADRSEGAPDPGTSRKSR
jgi:hypothetical protein